MDTKRDLEAWQLAQREYWNQREKRGWLLAVAPHDWLEALEGRFVKNGCSREQAQELVTSVFGVIQQNLMEQVMLMVVQRWLHGPLTQDEAVTTARHILEVGVGTGEFAVRMAPLIMKHGYGYTGLDFAEAMIEHTTKRLSNAGFEGSNINVVQGLATSLPREDKSTWLVAWGKFGCHLTNEVVWQRALKEVRRVIEPGGYFLLYEPMQDVNKKFKRKPRKSKGTYIRNLAEYDSVLAPMRRVDTARCQFCNEGYSLALWQKS